jgi:hypothetical protein
VLVAPLSIGRWIGFTSEARHHQDIPSAATFTVISIFGLSGLVNVLLLIWTRPGLLLLSDATTAPSSSNSQLPSIDDADSMRLHAETSMQANPSSTVQRGKL